MEKARIIEKASELLLNKSKKEAIDIINTEYKFEYKKVEKRAYKDKEKFNIFMRDGFIDRYTGDKLLNPGILKVFSTYFPEEFPYHSHWKMDQTHVAYWELIPTIDHINPIARGGKDEEDNWITTSMLHNSIKSNWSLEQIGWNIKECGDLSEWDGLTNIFIDIVERDTNLLNDNYIKKWYTISKSNVSGLYDLYIENINK
ncbi:HNH endonuclease signature motif containing protein [Romboutsia sp.]|uniref:HNH endonuclease n=1 Tax=Romboutsia sp. TaxID=1965302 RepID=UPI002C73D8BA|nr:HNH endonuclease signature motif containing protein [Romboutsia sp.]HSQ88888.1 HNH endonuclease signature motif containing protein [Romboutsia sp.]